MGRKFLIGSLYLKIVGFMSLLFIIGVIMLRRLEWVNI